MGMVGQNEEKNLNKLSSMHEGIVTIKYIYLKH